MRETAHTRWLPADSGIGLMEKRAAEQEDRDALRNSRDPRRRTEEPISRGLRPMKDCEAITLSVHHGYGEEGGLLRILRVAAHAKYGMTREA